MREFKDILNEKITSIESPGIKFRKKKENEIINAFKKSKYHKMLLDKFKPDKIVLNAYYDGFNPSEIIILMVKDNKTLNLRNLQKDDAKFLNDIITKFNKTIN
jgi:hypothetical protein